METVSAGIAVPENASSFLGVLGIFLSAGGRPVWEQLGILAQVGQHLPGTSEKQLLCGILIGDVRPTRTSWEM
jgi:hypothetical protein